MTEHKRPDLEEWEDQINALLDGDLDDASAGRLRAAAEDDRALATAIVEAYRLQQALAALPIEPAPASLRRKLRRIPRMESKPSRPFYLQPRWAAALAVIPLAVITLSVLPPRGPSDAELAQAKQDLALAFAYLEKYSRRTGQTIESTIGAEMNQAVTGTMMKTINEQFDMDKEHEA